jgi:hypothetical protein
MRGSVSTGIKSVSLIGTVLFVTLRVRDAQPLMYYGVLDIAFA